jgi:hypothetical protein
MRDFASQKSADFTSGPAYLQEGIKSAALAG